MSVDEQTRTVIFGSGPLGLSVMEALVARGRQAICLVNRTGRLGEALPAGVTVTQGDATNPDDVARLCGEAEVVFHCAQPAYHEWPEKFPPLTNGILEGVARSQARLVFGDNLYMVGPTGGRPIHEDLPYAATGPKGRTRAAMDRSLLEAHQTGRVRVAIGRASDFYGPRVLGSAVGEMFFGPALARKPVNVLGNPDLPHTYTYVRDFAQGLVTLSEREEAFGRAWHIPSAPTISTRQFADLVAAEIGRPVRLRPAGRWLVAAVGLFNRELRELKEILYQWEEPFIVDHSRFAQAFGNEATPHDVAIRETVAWFRLSTHPRSPGER
ncbi:MAG: NAD-dependent epimerase/dehydratase family protein [Chloroflexi bacterium]|nr:NAD-dependent epimerase/dehydratase family protein [Chloroflexota bacterium]MCI0578696.1 NAD-dependent epimerase/dehydratase family protein [Chloroflexota bacterium]MCI0648356.1 NAD-dependent epimerase/dehydratase family protein [Chloroflexota bacterium]MCI0731176.1 NAD-dependent epimerase/dehydratase family protein [Chloroflexota bacterium]